MSAVGSPVGFRRGLLLTSSGSITNLVLLSLETIIAARLLPTAVYGSYILLLTTVNFLVMAIDFGCKMTVTQLISSGERTRQEAVVGTALTFRVAVVAGTSALILLFRDVLAIVDPSPNLAEYVGYLPLMLAAASLDELLFATLQGFHAYRPMMVAQIIRGCLRIMLTVFLLIAFDAGIVALVSSWCISFAVAIGYQYWALPIRKVWGWRWATLVELLRFGSPLQLTGILGFASARLHLVLLGVLAGADSVAYLAAASRIPEALQTLTGSYFRVYFPTMTTLLAAGRQQAAALMFERSLRLVSFGGALAAVTATVFSHELVTLLFSSKYASSVPVFALLMIALHMTVLVNVLGYTLTAAGRPGRSLAVDMVRTVVIAAGALLLIPSLGAVGAAYGTVVGSYASNPVAAWLVRRSQLTIVVAPYIKQTLILALCAALGWWVQPAGLVAGLAYKAAIIATFIFLSFRLATISRDDLALVVGDRIRRPEAPVEPRPAPIRLPETRG